MLDALRFDTVSRLQFNVPVWMFVAVKSPVMILPPEMMVVSQFDAPMEFKVAMEPKPE